LTEEVAKKVNLLRPLIRLIYLTATEEQKTFVYKIITSCSETNKNEIIKLACQELVENWDF
jgi:predicted aspartyl protease